MVRLIVGSFFTVMLTACGGSSTPAAGGGGGVVNPVAVGFKTTMSSNTNTIVANGVTTATITVQARDINDVLLTVGGDTVVMTTSLGMLSSVTDNNDGTYTATLTSATSQGLATVTATINAEALEDFSGVRNRVDQADASFIALAALGKKIFEDTNLSNPTGQACASCHDAATGFDDPDAGDPTSLGADAVSIGTRNAQTASYAALIPQSHTIAKRAPVFIGGQFWDGRASTLKEQSKAPFENPAEMNSDRTTVLGKIKVAAYAGDFTTIFGINSLSLANQTEIDAAYDQMASAIEAHQQTVVFSPFTSKFDQVQAGTATFSIPEARGQNVFNVKAKCARCHSTPIELGEQVFSNFEYFNIGVHSNPTVVLANPGLVDNGAGDLPGGTATDAGEFRVPSLRNIANTAPYMHNGVLATLADVMDFYNAEISGVTPEININLSDGGQYAPLGLTAQDKLDVVAFLNTLTDAP